MIISIRSNIQGAIKTLTDLQQKQLPFAIAKALTDTAKQIQQEVIDNLPDEFTLRTQWYKSGPYAFKIIPATKTNPTATVYTNAPFMNLQESGGIKTPRGKSIAVPTDNVRPDKAMLIPSYLKPSFLLQGVGNTIRSGRNKGRMRWRGIENAQSAFIGEIHGQFGIWQRQHGTVRLMYRLMPQAKIDPRLHLYETGLRIVQMRFSENFSQAMDYAVRTAK